MSDLNDQYLRALDICRELNGEKAELEERIQQLEVNAAFFKCCALSGERPKKGAEPFPPEE